MVKRTIIKRSNKSTEVAVPTHPKNSNIEAWTMDHIANRIYSTMEAALIIEKLITNHYEVKIIPGAQVQDLQGYNKKNDKCLQSSRFNNDDVCNTNMSQIRDIDASHLHGYRVNIQAPKNPPPELDDLANNFTNIIVSQTTMLPTSYNIGPLRDRHIDNCQINYLQEVASGKSSSGQIIVGFLQFLGEKYKQSLQLSTEGDALYNKVINNQYATWTIESLRTKWIAELKGKHNL